MADIIEMTQLSPTMEEGVIVSWNKEEGDTVEMGEVIAEIETDKANMDMESFFDGTVLKILVAAGEAAPIGTPLAIIGDPDEDVDEILADLESGSGDRDGDEGGEDEASSGAEAASDESDEDAPAREDRGGGGTAERASSAPRKDDGGRIRSSPLARKMAEEHDLDLGKIDGSGPKGRVIKRDVEAAIESGTARRGEEAEAAQAEAPAVAKGEAASVVLEAQADGEDVKLSQMRKSIAKRLTQAWTAPAFMLTRELAIDDLLAMRSSINDGLARAERDRKISVNDLVLKAAGLALMDVPEMNVAFQGDSIRRFEHADIGMAVAVDGGLITPVLRHVEELSLGAINERSRELAERAREKKLSPEEYTGATFSVSNLGMYGIDHFTAVLNPPAAGILAVGRGKKVPVVGPDDELTIGVRMSVTLTCDHRAVDGAIGAEFLQAFALYIENPDLLVL